MDSRRLAPKGARDQASILSVGGAADHDRVDMHGVHITLILSPRGNAECEADVGRSGVPILKVSIVHRAVYARQHFFNKQSG